MAAPESTMHAATAYDRRYPRLKSNLLALVLGCLATDTALAVDATQRMTQYGHRSWNSQDGAFAGLPSAIEQTLDGYIWLDLVKMAQAGCRDGADEGATLLPMTEAAPTRLKGSMPGHPGEQTMSANGCGVFFHDTGSPSASDMPDSMSLSLVKNSGA